MVRTRNRCACPEHDGSTMTSVPLNFPSWSHLRISTWELGVPIPTHEFWRIQWNRNSHASDSKTHESSQGSSEGDTSTCYILRPSQETTESHSLTQTVEMWNKYLRDKKITENVSFPHLSHMQCGG